MNIPLVKTVAGVASFGALIPTPVTTAIGVAGIVTFAAVRKGAKRPSDALRMAEDGVVGLARRTKNVANRIGVEYTARKIEAAQRALEIEFETLSAMDPAERAAYDAAQAQVLQRVSELRAARRAKREVQPREARSA